MRHDIGENGDGNKLLGNRAACERWKSKGIGNIWTMGESAQVEVAHAGRKQGKGRRGQKNLDNRLATYAMPFVSEAVRGSSHSISDCYQAG